MHLMILLKLRLFLMSWGGRISFLKRLPIEDRYKLRMSHFPYNWKYARCYLSNLGHIFRVLGYTTSSRSRVNYDWWCLDVATSLWILPRLRAFKELSCEHIGAILDKDDPFYQLHYSSAIDDMIFAFEYPLRVGIRICGDELSPKDQLRRDKGLAAFAKFKSCLWD